MEKEGKQVKNGKAFEYALAITYFNELKNLGVNVFILEDESFKQAQKCFNEVVNEQIKFTTASKATFNTLIKIEPGLIAPKNEEDVLQIRIASDIEGRAGDVRDVIFSRQSSGWEIGISAKNNNEDAKHPRLGPKKKLPKEDWGKIWFNMKSTDAFWEEFNPVMERIEDFRSKGKIFWNDIKATKEKEIYTPTLIAFKNEIERLYQDNPKLPLFLTTFIIGKKPFYKIIKDDRNNLVVVKAFNIKGGLNQTINNKKAKFRVPKIDFPTKIIKFDFIEKRKKTNSLEMILDKGWSMNFRIHNAEDKLSKSLKFAVKLTGNPPILFSQFLFQEE